MKTTQIHVNNSGFWYMRHLFNIVGTPKVSAAHMLFTFLLPPLIAIFSHHCGMLASFVCFSGPYRRLRSGTELCVCDTTVRLSRFCQCLIVWWDRRRQCSLRRSSPMALRRRQTGYLRSSSPSLRLRQWGTYQVKQLSDYYLVLLRSLVRYLSNFSIWLGVSWSILLIIKPFVELSFHFSICVLFVEEAIAMYGFMAS